MDKLLTILASEARTPVPALAVMLGCSEEEIKERISKLERDGVIIGYNATVDWDKTDREYVTALIELRVTPERDSGFDRVARRVSMFDEVRSVFLASGGFDLCVTVECRTMQQVASFVASKLSPIEGIISTSTHFIMKKYKDNGEIFEKSEDDGGRKSCL